MGVAFTLLYRLVPNAPVRWRSALAGGLFTAVAWELAKALYARFAGSFLGSHPVHALLGEPLLFLAWTYVGWWLVLFGARLAYAFEHAPYPELLLELGGHPRGRELVGARLAQLIAQESSRAGEPPTLRSLSETAGLPRKVISEVLEDFVAAGLVVRTGEAVQMARPAGELTLSDISAAVGGIAKFLRSRPRENSLEFREVDLLFGELDEEAAKSLQRITWSDLAALGALAGRKRA
jgi:membrane protein